MSTTTLTADKIRQLNELVNVKKLSDLTDAPNIFDGADSSLLQTTYIPSTTYIANAKRYVNYKIKLEQLTQYLEHIGLNQIDDIERNINEILSHLVNTSSGQYIGLTYDETNNTYNIKQEYSQINSYGTWHEDYSYYTYNTLTSGIITSSVLDEYITYTMGRILGVPSTETALSEAIDSVVEFVDWFKDYGKNEDGLRALIDKIESKDAEIISSYMTADNKNLNLAYAYTETSYNKLYNAMQDIDVEVPVMGVSNINKITVGNVTYVLELNNDKNLQISIDIDNYSVIELQNVTSSITQNLEYKSNVTNSTINLSATASKPCQSNGWIVKAGNTASISNKSNNNLTYTAIGNYGPIDSGTSSITYSWTISVTEILSDSDIAHGHITAAQAEKTVNVQCNFNQYGYWYIVDENNDLTFENVKSNNNYPTNSNGYTTNMIKFGSSLFANGPKYIYLLLKKKTSGDFSFKIGQGENEGQSIGGMTLITDDINNIYDNTTPYQLWRSSNPLSAACNVKIS